MVTPAVTPTVTLSTTPMVDSAVEVPLPPARVQGMPRQGMPSHCASRQPRAAAPLGSWTKTFQLSSRCCLVITPARGAYLLT